MNDTVPGQRLLRLCARLVPESHRDEWFAEWNAELVHAWHACRDATAANADATNAHEGKTHAYTEVTSASTETTTARQALALRLRCLGAVRDAAWMRRRHRATVRKPAMLATDVRYACRALARRPGFAAVVIGTLAICIGASTAVFSVVHSVLLDGLPYAHPERLVTIWSHDTTNDRERNEVSVGDYRDMRERARTLSSVAAYFAGWNVTYTDAEKAERLEVGVVSANFLRTLGVTPMLGRGFMEGEDEPGARNVVVLGHEFWSRQFGRDSTIVGKRIMLDGQPYDVVGVMHDDFVFPGARVDLMAPLPLLGSFLTRREVHLVTLVGRMQEHVPLDAVQRELSGIAAQLEKEYPSQNAGFGATVLPTRTAMLGEVRTPIVVLFGAVTFVLLIGCANVANLMLARATSRRHELSLRVALGAERGRLVRQLLTESAVVATAAGVIGVALAFGAVEVLAAILPPDIARLASIRMSMPVLLFTLGISVAATLLCGLLPALQGARQAMRYRAQESGRGTPSRNRRRTQGVLVISELALSLVLVISAGLLINSFARLTTVDPGFRTDDVVRMKVSLTGAKYGTSAARRQHFTSLLEQVRELPGVQSAGAISRFPLHDNNITTSVLVEGSNPLDPNQLPDADLRIAAGDYFRTLDIPLLAGRLLSGEERTNSAAVRVAVINRTAALQLFGEGSPVGRRMQLGGHANAPFVEIVGVVGDVQDASLREPPRPQLFLPAEQSPTSTLSIVVRHDGSAGDVLAGVRDKLRTLDPSLPLYDVQRVDEVVRAASVGDRFATLLLSAFSAVALLLAAVGTYGVISYGVAERTREIGVRMALGAQQSAVRRMVLGEGARLVLFALPLGLAGAWATTRVLQNLLFGVTANDMVTTMSAVLVLVVASLVACYVPARRASRVDPLAAIRFE